MRTRRTCTEFLKLLQHRGWEQLETGVFAKVSRWQRNLQGKSKQSALMKS
jgi:hypothetical protein